MAHSNNPGGGAALAPHPVIPGGDMARLARQRRRATPRPGPPCPARRSAAAAPLLASRRRRLRRPHPLVDSSGSAAARRLTRQRRWHRGLPAQGPSRLARPAAVASLAQCSVTEQRLAAEAAASRAMPVRPPCDSDDGTHAAAARLAMLHGTPCQVTAATIPRRDAAAGRDVVSCCFGCQIGP